MSTSIKNFKKMQKLLNNMSDKDKTKLNELLLICIKEYINNPVDTITKCIQEISRQENKEEDNNYSRSKISKKVKKR